MTFNSRASLPLFRQLVSGPAVASSSRNVTAAAFSTTSSTPAAPTKEDSTSRKPPFTASSEAYPSPFEPNAIGRGRRAAGRSRPKALPPFEEWMVTDAKAYKRPKPGMGPNWIGETPFPLNPAFNPPPPVRQKTKTEIWQLHASDPKKWTIRALSEKYSIGTQRMEAILRLKALENEWTAEKKPLQEDFQYNMDKLLGAQDRTRAPEQEPATQSHDISARGVQHEEFSEADPLNAPSVIASALHKEAESRSSMIAALPSGGPDAEAKSSSKTVQPSAPNQSPPKLLITNVSGESYKGAGRLERNLRRAARRKGNVSEESRKIASQLRSNQRSATTSQGGKPNAPSKATIPLVL